MALKYTGGVKIAYGKATQAEKDATLAKWKEYGMESKEAFKDKLEAPNKPKSGKGGGKRGRHKATPVEQAAKMLADEAQRKEIIVLLDEETLAALSNATKEAKEAKAAKAKAVAAAEKAIEAAAEAVKKAGLNPADFASLLK